MSKQPVKEESEEEVVDTSSGKYPAKVPVKSSKYPVKEPVKQPKIHDPSKRPRKTTGSKKVPIKAPYGGKKTKEEYGVVSRFIDEEADEDGGEDLGDESYDEEAELDASQ